MISLKKRYFYSKYQKIYREINTYIPSKSTILDVGCGNLVLANMLVKGLNANVTGIDVVDIPKKPKNVKFVKYDGENIPFPNKSFDISYLIFVLHHTTDPETLLNEVRRVTKKRIIILEYIYNNWLDKQLLKLFDLTNLFDSPSIPLPFNFKNTSEWKTIFSPCAKEIIIKNLPRWFRPFEGKVFIVDLKHI